MSKNTKKLFFIGIACLILSVFCVCHDSFAAKDVVETNLFGNLKEDGKGCGVYTVLNLCVDILSMGVGILAVIAIVVMGIKYLTAKGNEEQTKKAKVRLLEILVAIVVYALSYSALQLLLPGGKFNVSQTCTVISDDELAEIDAEEGGSGSGGAGGGSGGAGGGSGGSAPGTPVKPPAENKTPAEKLSETAVKLAWPVSQKKKAKSSATSAFTAAMKATKTNKGETGCRKSGKACGMFVGTVVRYAGIDSKFPTTAYSIYKYVKKSSNWKQVSTKNPQPGDISLSRFSNGNAQHVSIYVKNKKGKTVSAQASLCDFYGVMSDKKMFTGSSNKTFRYIGK